MQSLDGLPGSFDQFGGVPVPAMLVFVGCLRFHWLGRSTSNDTSQTGYYDDVIAEAAALWESLSQNHPFIDGNKRTAFAATFTFLLINGFSITADEESSEFLIPLYERSALSFDVLEGWLRSHIRAI